MDTAAAGGANHGYQGRALNAMRLMWPIAAVVRVARMLRQGAQHQQLPVSTLETGATQWCDAACTMPPGPRWRTREQAHCPAAWVYGVGRIVPGRGAGVPRGRMPPQLVEPVQRPQRR